MFRHSVLFCLLAFVVTAWPAQPAEERNAGDTYDPNGALAELDSCDWFQVAKPIAADASARAWFGESVSISGDTAIVGARRDADSPMYSVGSAYVLERDAGGVDAWGQVAKLRASDRATGDYFGDVSISGDVAVVGAHLDDHAGGMDAGSAYVFERNAGGANAWGQVAKLTASDASDDVFFGESVSVSGDHVVVGARSAPDGGAAYVFRRDAGDVGAWGQVVKLTAVDTEAFDRFGGAVSIDGNLVVVGASLDDHAGGLVAGSAYVFERDAGGTDAWGHVAKLTAADTAESDWFGNSVSINGDIVVVGALLDDHPGGMDAGSAYVFERNAGGTDAWGQVAKLTAADAAVADLFGRSVSISGETVVVGASGDDHSALFSAGSAYVFKRDTGGPGAWGQVVRLKAADPARFALFGFSVSISGETLIVGARQDDHEGGEEAGSSYIFETPCASCGDGIVETPEQCDDGVQNSDLIPDACRTDCSLPACGDGVADAGEACDDGTENSDFIPDACRIDCSLPACGDGVADMGEQCDDGVQNSDRIPDACRIDCTLPICGDNVTDMGEQCDDANTVAGDGCDPTCTFHPANSCRWTEAAKPVASDAEAGDDFGYSVSISGDTAVVGANRGRGTVGLLAGSVYVLERDAGGPDAWGQVAKLTAADAGANDRFGFSVSIFGNTAVVGAVNDGHSGGPFAGSAYVFERNTGGANAWGQVAKLTAADAVGNDQFGFSVSIFGNTALVGAANDTHSVITSAGSVYVFERHAGGENAWGQVAKLTAADISASARFGSAVSIFENTAVVGAPFDSPGSTYVFERNAGDAGVWGQVVKLTAADREADDRFGYAVSISGNTAIVGAVEDDNEGGVDAGSAYMFERHSEGANAWGQVARLTALDAAAGDFFGTSVSIHGGIAIVGTRSDDHEGGMNAGSAYIFELNAGGTPTWGQVTKLTASDAAANDQFGRSVSIGGQTAVVGGPEGNHAGGESAGSSYVFNLPLTCSTCGDGITETPEQCDDGNNNDGDGCGAMCEVCTDDDLDEEVTELAFTSGENLTWQELVGASSYAVYRGAFDADTWTFDHTCFDSQISTPEVTDDEIPGVGFYYLVTGMDPCDEGTLGTTTEGDERWNGVACP